MSTKHFRKAALAAAATVTLVSMSQPSRAGLAINWIGDDYTGNGNWLSNNTTGSLLINATTAGGFTIPTAVPNAFGTHTGVDFTAAGSAFDVPSGTTPISLNPANFTVAVAFKASGPASSTGGNFFQGQMIFGNDSPGGGTNDWCFTYGGTGNQSIFGSIGRVGGDSAFQTGSLDISQVHAVAMVVDATNSTQSYFVDGKLVGRATGITINPRDNPLFYRIGGGFFNGSFNGRIAEIRVYDDAGQNGLALSQQLANAYGGSYPIQQLFTWTDGAGAFQTGTNWDVGTAPTDLGYHQALVNNGGTIQISGSGSFNVSDLWVGSGSSGVGHVAQTGATLNVGVSLILGQSGGTGDYDISGGTLNAANLTVAGGGTALNTATMTVRGNAVVNVNGGTLNVAGGGGTLNSGAMTVRDTAVVNINGGQPVRLGNTGTATFVLQDTAQFNTGTSEFWVGNGSTFSAATMGMTGGTFNVNNWLAVGRDRSNGTLNLSGGVINKTGNGNITIGAVNNSTFTSNGTVNQTGGQIVAVRNASDAAAPGLVGGEIYVGETTQGKGTWNFSAGTASTPVVSVGFSGQGTLNLSGTAQITSDAFGVARAGTFGGVANLNGGTITTAQLFRGGSTGPAQVNFNGTTVVASADNDRFVAGFGTADLVLQSGGAVINTNGHNLGIDSGFNGTGPLIKNGAGVLTLNAGAANTHSGNTVVNAGTLKLDRVTANNSILARNVAAYYRFNDASNVGKDSSPNANDVFDVFGTATITTATAPPNHTASLSLPSNFVNQNFLSTGDGNVPTGFPSGNSSYTIAAWIDVDGANTNQTNGIVGWGDLGATPGRQRSSITFRTQNNGGTPNGLRNSWFIVDNAANLGAGSSLLNQWHHVVATYDTNTDIRRIFYDGNLLVSDFLPGLNNAGTQNFRIGMATLGEAFSGNMADLLVTGSSLTQAQIQQLYNNGLTFGSFTGGSGALSANSLVQIASGATLDLNGASSPSGGLGDITPGSAGTVTSSAAGSAVLTLTPVGSASFSGVIQNGAGTVGITKSGSGTQILRGANTYTGTTTVGGGTLVLTNAANSPVLTGPGGADIQHGRIVFDYTGGASPATQIESLLTTSYNNNGFNNTTSQLRSSTATSAKGLGWVDDGAKVHVAEALYGDADLTGNVDLTDFTFLAANFNKPSGAIWKNGDFNYDDKVDLTDFTFLASNFNQSLPAEAASLGATVPEPAAVTIAFMLAAGLTSRMRRRH